MSGLSLAMSASAGPCSVALRTVDGRIHEPATPTDARGDDLAAQVRQAFQTAGVEPRALREVRVDLGPGSYTGLRIAVTFARVLHSFLDVPVWTATNSDLMALCAWSQGAVDNDRAIRPILDARRNRFHHARVELHGKTTLTEMPAAVPREELLSQIRADEVLLADTALHEMLADRAQEVGASVVAPLVFGAGMLFHDQLGLQQAAAHELEPLYLMGSYAE